MTNAACEQFEGNQEMMDRVRKVYLQDQRYTTTFVRILLVPLSAPLNYDFKGGGESTRDGRVKGFDRGYLKWPDCSCSS